jgi:hypothetical protein
MKKSLVSIALIVILSILFLGCISSSPSQQDDPIRITKTDFTVSSDFEDRYSVVIEKAYDTGNAVSPVNIVKGFHVNIKNNAETNIKINWNNSSISDAMGTHRLFLDGQKYIDAGNDIPSLVIPPNGSVVKVVYSADSPRFNHYWSLRPMIGQDFTLVICIEDGGQENYVNVEIKIETSV